jgi:NADPH:quinone reductase-like Zn-dependent oxidoreductase
MRQIWIPRVGPPEVLTLQQRPDPDPGPSEVRIRVEVSGVNFSDILTRLGLYPDAPALPAVIGYEVAGVVDAIGPGPGMAESADGALSKGDAVMAATHFGGYSDVVCVPAAHVIRRPASMSAQTAVAFLLSYQTAYALLVEAGRARAGDTVLIRGAAGGVGLAAVDLCQLLGTTVIATASEKKHAFLRSRGVDEPIDPRATDVAQAVRHRTGGRGVDIALDPVGGRSWSESLALLTPFGRLVPYGFSSLATGVAPTRIQTVASLVLSMARIPWLQSTPISLMNQNRGVVGVNLGHLWSQVSMFRSWFDQLLAWYDADKIHPHYDRDFDFEHAADAHRYLQERRNIGKVGLVP